jgi:hypothetical protein
MRTSEQAENRENILGIRYAKRLFAGLVAALARMFYFAYRVVISSVRLIVPAWKQVTILAA